MPEFEVRAFQRKDLPRVAKLERLCNSLPWKPEALQEFTEDPETLSPSLSGKWGRVAILPTTQEVLGYLCVQVLGDEAEILVLGVAPEHRRHGIGRRLLLDLGGLLRPLQCRNVFLEVRSGNRAARALYLSAGFTETGLRKGYYADTGEDARLMRWELTGPEATG